MKNSNILKIILTFALLQFSIIASADTCIKAKISKGKVKLSKTTTSGACPSGSVSLPASESFTEGVPSGKTIRGVVAFDHKRTAGELVEIGETLTAPASATLDDDKVVIKYNSVVQSGCGSDACLGSDASATLQANCTGTSENPTAAPGYVCIYPTFFGGLSNISGNGMASKYGFVVAMLSSASGSGNSYFFATYAYTAP